MAPGLAPFDLHEWHNDNDSRARYAIGGSGIPRAELTPYLPKSAKEWQQLWSTPPNHVLSGLADQVEAIYGFDPKEVLFTMGASEADFLATFGLAGPGAHVIVEQPAYFALLEPAQALGCTVTRIQRSPAAGFVLDAAAVEAAITKNTKLILLARPNNPTGHRVADRDLKRIADAAERVGAYVVVDEVFAEATKAGDVPARRLHDRILSVNSITKTLGFGPMHVGWIASPAKIRNKLHRAKGHVRPLNPILSLALAARILPHRKAILAKTRARRAATVPIVRAFVAQHPEVEWHPQEHGTTTVLRLPGKIPDDLAFTKRLLKEEGIMVSPGSFIELPGWIRIGLLTPPEALRAGLEAVGRALEAKRRKA